MEQTAINEVDAPLVGLYGVKDLKADVITFVFCESTPHSAMRSFGMTCRDPKGMFSQFPDDFALVHLGWVSKRGALMPFDSPIQQCTARDFVGPSTSVVAADSNA